MDNYMRIPLEELQTPKHGFVVHADSWWIITPEDEALIWTGPKGNGYALQCNSNEKIARAVCSKLQGIPEGSRVEFIKTAYIDGQLYYGS